MSDTSSMFYGWETWEVTGAPGSHFRDDNPPFSTSSYSRLPYGRTLLKGYMRSSLPEKYGKARFHFQYNPNTLTRSTTVNQDLLGTANWTPSEWQAASLAGNGASFGFSLLLDRQDEVATAEFSHVGAASGNNDPKLGVLVDLMVLDKVAGIGQVLNAADFINSVNPLDFIRDPSGIADDLTNAIKASSDGNQAFMASAQPVRCVFSKNLVTEGFLNQVDVTFTKFSVDMVPTVATVQCSMQAFYIGNARASTWWSSAVSNGELTNAIKARAAPSGTEDVLRAGDVTSSSSSTADSPPKQNYGGNNARPNVVNSRGQQVVNGSGYRF